MEFGGENIKSWDMHFCRSEFAHNHASNRSTGLSPFCILYGMITHCPLDLKVILDPTRFHGQAVGFFTDLSRIHEQTRAHLEATTSTKQQYTENYVTSTSLLGIKNGP